MNKQDARFYKALGFLIMLLVALMLLSSNTVNQPFTQTQQIGWYLGLIAMVVGSWAAARS